MTPILLFRASGELEIAWTIVAINAASCSFIMDLPSTSSNFSCPSSTLKTLECYKHINYDNKFSKGLESTLPVGVAWPDSGEIFRRFQFSTVKIFRRPFTNRLCHSVLSIQHENGFIIFASHCHPWGKKAIEKWLIEPVLLCDLKQISILVRHIN